MDDIEFAKKKLEYNAAQEMVRHYDTLNWQIGGILVAATIVFTGLVLREDAISLIRIPGWLGWVVVVGVPLFSLCILLVWLFWFRRHRDLYNFRHETLHRLEMELGLYHHLRVVEGQKLNDSPTKPKEKQELEEAIERLKKAKVNAGHGPEEFIPFYDLRLSKPSGYRLVKWLVCGIPAFQVIFLALIKCL